MSTEELEIPTDMEGWDWFGGQKVSKAEQRTQQRSDLTPQELDFYFRRMTESKSGQIVMAHLQDLLDSVDEFDPDLGFYDGAAYGFKRSGMRALVNYIKQRAQNNRGESK